MHSGWPDGNGSYHNIAPSPPGISYGYHSSRRRQLYVNEIERIRDRQRAEERNAILNILETLDGTLDQPPSEDWTHNYTRNYQWLVLKHWQEYRDAVLKPKWEREIDAFEQSAHNRRARSREL